MESRKSHRRTWTVALLSITATVTAHAAPDSGADASSAADNADTADAPQTTSTTPGGLSQVTVIASRLNLLGTATTASQGSVTEQELELRPAYRVGQLLESVPGLVVTVHSGEGKANQYL